MRNKKLKFGFSQASQSAPLWLQNTLSVCALLFAAKQIVIGGMPLLSEEHKELAGLWWDYSLNILNVIIAVAMILLGEHVDDYDSEQL